MAVIETLKHLVPRDYAEVHNVQPAAETSYPIRDVSRWWR
jgi:hypothetical protein